VIEIVTPTKEETISYKGKYFFGESWIVIQEMQQIFGWWLYC